MFEQLTEWQSTLIALLLIFILINIWLERYRRSNKTEYCFKDKGASVKLIYSPSYQVFKTNVTVIPKEKVVKIKKNAHLLTLSYKSGHTVDLTVTGQALQDLFDQACFLFPMADIEEASFRSSSQLLKPGSHITVKT